MHELSLCRSIESIVARAAQGRRVERVHLQVGQLRQVVPQTLTYCWELLTTDTPLAGSALVIDHIPVTVTCTECAAVTTVEHQLVLVCRECQSGSVTVTTGEEFLLTSLDLVKEP